jgi:hypothetical protein
MQDADARFTVRDECLTVARTNSCREVIEVAAEIEDARRARTQQQLA